MNKNFMIIINYRFYHRKERNIKERIKKKNDITYRILCNLRVRLNKAIRNNQKKGTTLLLINCSIEKLKKHLEKQFKKGMNWSNYGKWHIDHIRPCASFDLSKESEQHKCFNYKNLQPLWKKENCCKKDKIL